MPPSQFAYLRNTVMSRHEGGLLLNRHKLDEMEMLMIIIMISLNE
jgi:hypothetical protein